jgi:hypothetical protein
LVLLAEGTTSTDDTRRGRALHRALSVVRRQVESGARSENALIALVENWTLGYSDFTGEERHDFARAIHSLLQGARGPDAYPAGRYWADQAGFPIGGPVAAPEVPCVVIASLHENGERGRRRVAPTYANAFRIALPKAREGDAAALLTLQAPYRL